MKKSILFAGLAAFFLCIELSGASVRKSEKQPNIVVLFVDDLGYYDVGFRNPKFHTPHIDQLANKILKLLKN